MKTLLLLLVTALVTGCQSGTVDNISGQQGQPAPSNPPVAVNDNYNAFVNAPIQVAAAQGVLANDTVNGATITAFDNPSAQGGAVNLAADGSFIYTPAANFQGADTFTYTLTNAAGQSTATVTITVAGTVVFVDNSNPNPPGDGSFGNPFTTLAAAVAASAPGDTIFVFSGNAPYNESVTLLANQRLVGEGSGLLARGQVLAQTVVPPDGFPVLTGTVTLADNNTVQGLRFEGGAPAILAPFVDGTPQVTDGTIVGNQFVNGVLTIDINDADGTWTITGNSFQGGGTQIAISGSLLTGQEIFLIVGNTFNASGRALFLGVSGTVNARAQVVGNTATNITDPSSFRFTIGDNSTLCVDLEGNVTNTNYDFSQIDASVLNVEQFSTLVPNLNTGGVTSSGVITEVPDGFCGF